MHPKRARFKDDIIAEFLPPTKLSNKVIVFCDGMPVIPKRNRILNFFSKRGYWIIVPRYRGSWESRGEFLADEPTKDILDVIDELDKPLKDIWTGEEFILKPKDIYLIGASFGGPAAILGSRDPRVKKAVCFCPVVDWTAESEDEPMDIFGPLVKNAFGEGYRYSLENWDKLAKGELYQPVNYIDEIDGKKLLILHTEDDTVVMPNPVRKFAKDVGAGLIMMKKGGHCPKKMTTGFWMWFKIKRFLEV